MPAQEQSGPKSNLDFRLMSLTYQLRDFLLPRMSILKEVGIKAGSPVVDYGCGPGSYIKPLAQLVGKSGKIYALDVYPLAIKAVQRMVVRERLANVQTILSDCKTGLPPASVDVVLLYDILHDLWDYGTIIAELHRILKPNGVLSVSDHHLKEGEIMLKVSSGGLFRFSAKGKKAFSFSREER